MNLYQRKTLVTIIAIHVIFGVQQYFANQTVVFPSPINPFLFLVAAVFFTFKTIRFATWTERILMLLLSSVGLIQIFTDVFMLEILMGHNHEMLRSWMSSNSFLWLELIGVSLLLITLPIIAFQVKSINNVYFVSVMLLVIGLTLLAFFQTPMEALIGIGILAAFFFYLLQRYNEQIMAGVSGAMHLWMIYFFLECVEYWNLQL